MRACTQQIEQVSLCVQHQLAEQHREATRVHLSLQSCSGAALLMEHAHCRVCTPRRVRCRFCVKVESIQDCTPVQYRSVVLLAEIAYSAAFSSSRRPYASAIKPEKSRSRVGEAAQPQSTVSKACAESIHST